MYQPLPDKTLVDLDDIRAHSTTRIQHVQDKSTFSGYDKYKVTCSCYGETESVIIKSLSDISPAIESNQSQILKRINSF